MELKEYSIWLLPEDKDFQKFGQIINKVARENGTPAFDPHITLTGGIPIDIGEAVFMEKGGQLASRTSRMEVGLTEVRFEDFYYRAIILLAGKKDELVSLNRRSKEMYGLNPADYMPHLSLLYGDLTRDRKLTIVRDLDLHLPEAISVDRLRLIRAEGSRVEDWITIAEFPLQPV